VAIAVMLMMRRAEAERRHLGIHHRVAVLVEDHLRILGVVVGLFRSVASPRMA